MGKKLLNKHEEALRIASGSHDKVPGYPKYPMSEDIYQNALEIEIDPDHTLEKKISIPQASKEGMNEKSFDDDMTGGDLDIPGDESDNENDNLSNSDEENDYYSLGGDDHNDLDESGADPVN